MDNDQLARAMRKSFKKILSMSPTPVPTGLSERDIHAMSALGLVQAAPEPYRPVSAAEAKAMLEEISRSYSKQKLEGYLADAQNRVTEAIIKPFGLAKVLFEDKKGGNVTTEHNARKGVYANEADKYNPADYKTNDYRKAASEIKEKNISYSDALDDLAWDEPVSDDPSWVPDIFCENEANDYITDTYSGHDTLRKETDADHIISTESYHESGGFMQSKEKRRAFGSDSGNLAPTARSGNRSKGSNDIYDWQRSESPGGNGRSQKEVHGHDNRRVNPAVARASKSVEKHLPSDAEKVAYYSRKTAETGLQEGARMGLQQAMGAFLLELSRALWDELRDVLATGICTQPDQSLMSGIVARLRHTGERVLSKWKSIINAFKDGAISGFLSNLVTVVINMFMTTAKNAVRVIREGFMSLVQGVKFALFPPDGFTREEAFHEAGKLVIGGVAVGLGIMAEEGVTKGIALIPVIGPMIKPFADTIAPVLVGIAVGLGTSFLCYLWDKLDLFHAEEKRRHEFIIQMLDKEQQKATTLADAAVTERNGLAEECDRLIADIEAMDKEFWESTQAALT